MTADVSNEMKLRYMAKKIKWGVYFSVVNSIKVPVHKI